MRAREGTGKQGVGPVGGCERDRGTWGVASWAGPKYMGTLTPVLNLQRYRCGVQGRDVEVVYTRARVKHAILTEIKRPAVARRKRKDLMHVVSKVIKGRRRRTKDRGRVLLPDVPRVLVGVEPRRIARVHWIVSGSCSFRRESRSTETGLMSVSWEGDALSDVVSGAPRGARRERVFLTAGRSSRRGGRLGHHHQSRTGGRQLPDKTWATGG